MFDITQRISAFEILGQFLSQYKGKKEDAALEKLNKYFFEEYQQLIEQAGIYNNWFTRANVEFALEQWSNALSKENMMAWVNQYEADFFSNYGDKQIALIMAGNLPLVGFHDLLSVLLCGHSALIKPSSDDDKLIPFVAQLLVAIDRNFVERIKFADGKMTGFDAVIATGSNNSSRYFDYYFSKYPHIIRKNRTSVALIEGDETEADLEDLGKDVFTYFGLGCRNVSKLYVPKDYDINHVFKGFYKYKDVIDNKKYGNNYDYNRAIFMLEKQDFLENGFVIIKESEHLHAPAAVVYLERYDDLETVKQKLESISDELQCVVGKKQEVAFGQSQMPKLWDYADKVDTLKFLRTI